MARGQYQYLYEQAQGEICARVWQLNRDRLNRQPQYTQDALYNLLRQAQRAEKQRDEARDRVAELELELARVLDNRQTG